MIRKHQKRRHGRRGKETAARRSCKGTGMPGNIMSVCLEHFRGSLRRWSGKRID